MRECALYDRSRVLFFPVSCCIALAVYAVSGNSGVQWVHKCSPRAVDQDSVSWSQIVYLGHVVSRVSKVWIQDKSLGSLSPSIGHVHMQSEILQTAQDINVIQIKLENQTCSEGLMIMYAKQRSGG